MSLTYWHPEKLIFKRCSLLPHQEDKKIKERSWQGSDSKHIPRITSVFLCPGLSAVFPPPSLQGSMGYPERKSILAWWQLSLKPGHSHLYRSFCFSLPVIQSEPWNPSMLQDSTLRTCDTVFLLTTALNKMPVRKIACG